MNSFVIIDPLVFLFTEPTQRQFPFVPADTRGIVAHLSSLLSWILGSDFGKWAVCLRSAKTYRAGNILLFFGNDRILPKTPFSFPPRYKVKVVVDIDASNVNV